MKVLVVGLDDTTVQFLANNGINFEREDIGDAEDLTLWLADKLFDAAIVDLEHSALGIYVARGLRAANNPVPLIGISTGVEGQRWSDHRAKFLENGGDDLLHSPANPRELIASLRAATRRYNGSLVDVTEITKGNINLKINHTTLSVRVNGSEPELTGSELRLLLLLAASAGRVLSKELIMQQLYRTGVEDEPEMKIIDVFICKLRKKLAAIDPAAETLIETVWARGYRLGEAKDDLAA